MIELTKRHCAPCEGGVAPLTTAGIQSLHAMTPLWTVRKDGKELERTFEFPDYWRVMGFVNAVAWIASVEDHHPDMAVSYNRVVVRWSTHAIKGLSDNDFIGAAKVDALVAK